MATAVIGAKLFMSRNAVSDSHLSVNGRNGSQQCDKLCYFCTQSDPTLEIREPLQLQIYLHGTIDSCHKTKCFRQN